MVARAEPGLPEWAIAWQKGEPTPTAEALAWMRSRPDAVKALMRRFPPSCLVRATCPLLCPAPGAVAIVHSYGECDNLTVRDSPIGDTKYWCGAGDLDVVGYYHGQTPAWVEAVLAATD